MFQVEIEHVDADALENVAKKGMKVEPSPWTIRTIQDKFLQKQHFSQHGIPLPRFEAVGSKADIEVGASLGFKIYRDALCFMAISLYYW